MEKVISVKKYPHVVMSSIYAELSARDYTFSETLAEFIDNCLAARYVNPLTGRIEPLYIDITYSHDRFRIYTNGKGQNEKGLSKTFDLGRLGEGLNVFGVGLKKASAWLGYKITAVAKQYGEFCVHICKIDIKDLINNPRPLSEINKTIKNVSPYSRNGEDWAKKDRHFFEITVESLHPRNFYEPYIRGVLSTKYGPYLKNNVIIILNGRKIRIPSPPKLVILPTYGIKQKKFTFPKLGIEGWWGIVPPKTAGRSRYGANTFYSERLITSYDKHILGIGPDPSCKVIEHPRYWGLRTDIYFKEPCIFDNNQTSNKNAWKRDKNYDIVQKALYEKITIPFTEELSKLKKMEKETEETKLYKNIGKSAPPHLKKAFPDLIQPRKRKKFRRLKNGEDDSESKLLLCDVRKQSPPIKPSKNPSGIYKGEQKPRNTHFSIRPHIPFYIEGIPFDLQVEATSILSETAPRYVHTVDKKNHVIILSINENRKNIKVMEINELVPLIIDWIIEVIILVTLPPLSHKEFIQEREERLCRINMREWFSELRKLEHEESLRK